MKHTPKPNDDSPSYSNNIDREIDRDRCSVYTTHTTLHSIVEQRKAVQVRMKPTIHKVVGRYCGKDISLGQFYEEAAILFMELNPKDGVYLNVEKPERNNKNMDDRIQEMICVSDLSEFLQGKRKPLHKKIQRRILGLLKECRKVNNRGEELTALMMEAMELCE